MDMHDYAPGEGAEGGARLEADPVELDRYADALFRYADPGTYVSLRSFTHEQGTAPAAIEGVRLGDDRKGLTAAAVRFATKTANAKEPRVFAPPVATFTNARHAGEADIANGLVISIELDAWPRESLQRLVAVLGIPTLIMASGGVWVDPEAGEVQDKLHVYHRLDVPTRTAAEHAKLKLARRYLGLWSAAT